MTRLLVILPSWLGDSVMATPALRLLRTRLPGAFIGGLVRAGIDEVLAGSSLLDEIHVYHAGGVMAPKHAAGKVRPRRYDAALLLANSFSSALIARLAGIPRRVGYSRDARAMLLTDRLTAPARPDGRWAPVPAVEYYMHAARCLLDASHPRDLVWPAGTGARVDHPVHLELVAAPAEQAAAGALLARGGVAEGRPFAILNPGGNRESKRWPPERFAALATHLVQRHGLGVLANGSPAEADLVDRIAELARPTPIVALPRLGVTVGSLKGLLSLREASNEHGGVGRQANPSPNPLHPGGGAAGLQRDDAERRATQSNPRCRLMVTNDTGPRHLAAAFGVPLVSLFGPTDHRWTTIPTAPGLEAILLADPTLPADQTADDHPDRCRIDRISLESVIEAAEKVAAVAPYDGADIPGA